MKPESGKKILVIYTGGTIGMIKDRKSGALVPFDFNHLYQHIPSLSEVNCQIDSISFQPLVDSSDMKPSFWIEVASMIREAYEKYDGFVVLHGSDTMAYTASVLSFLLENLSKPVVLTGSQLPMGVIRTDGRDNFINAIEIATAVEDGQPIVPEVSIFFENKLYRGNRTTKLNAEHFEAFVSGNYPTLAKTGVHIRFKKSAIMPVAQAPLKVYTQLNTQIGILKLYPGISPALVDAILETRDLQAVVLETFGSGNAPTDAWFIAALSKAVSKGMIILNVTQCKGGSVHLGKYSTSLQLGEIGVLSGYDITTEAAVAKLMFLLGNYSDRSVITQLLQTPLRGEMTI